MKGRDVFVFRLIPVCERPDGQWNIEQHSRLKMLATYQIRDEHTHIVFVFCECVTDAICFPDNVLFSVLLPVLDIGCVIAAAARLYRSDDM